LSSAQTRRKLPITRSYAGTERIVLLHCFGKGHLGAPPCVYIEVGVVHQRSKHQPTAAPKTFPSREHDVLIQTDAHPTGVGLQLTTGTSRTVYCHALLLTHPSPPPQNLTRVVLLACSHASTGVERVPRDPEGCVPRLAKHPSRPTCHGWGCASAGSSFVPPPRSRTERALGGVCAPSRGRP
jgi:hypothetical protein